MQVSGGGEFRGEIVQREHPVMKGVQPFPAWEENFAPAQPAGGPHRPDGARRRIAA